MNKKAKIAIGVLAAAGGIFAVTKLFNRGGKNWATVFASKNWGNADQSGNLTPIPPTWKDTASITGNIITLSSGIVGQFVDENTIQFNQGSVWRSINGFSGVAPLRSLNIR
jgi:hypothetical protein